MYRLIDPGMGIQTDAHQPPSRPQHAVRFGQKGRLVLEMMEGVNAIDAVERLIRPRKLFGQTVHEWAARPRLGQHADGRVQPRDAKAPRGEQPKPMPSPTANFEHPAIEILSDELDQRVLDTRVIVMPIPANRNSCWRSCRSQRGDA